MAKQYDQVIPKEAWQKIDPEALPTDAKDAYNALRSAWKIAKERKEKFEALVHRGCPQGKRIVISYKGLSMAVVDATEVEVKERSKRVAMPLADFLALQQNSGFHS